MSLEGAYICSHKIFQYWQHDPYQFPGMVIISPRLISNGFAPWIFISTSLLVGKHFDQLHEMFLHSILKYWQSPCLYPVIKECKYTCVHNYICRLVAIINNILQKIDRKLIRKTGNSNKCMFEWLGVHRTYKYYKL